MKAKPSRSDLLQTLPITALLLLLWTDNALLIAVGSAVMLCGLLLLGVPAASRRVGGRVALIGVSVAVACVAFLTGSLLSM